MWTLRFVLAAGALSVLGATAALPALAQSANSSVTVDMSVLDDGGYGSTLGAPGMIGGLKIPGRKTPVSRFHAPPGYAPSAAPTAPASPARQKITLKKPRPAIARPAPVAVAKPKPLAPAVAAKPAMAEKPAPKPVAKAAPKPTKAAPKPAKAAEPAKKMTKAPAKPTPVATPKAMARAPTEAKKAPAPAAPAAPKPATEKAAPKPPAATAVAKAVDPGSLKPGRVYQVMFADTATKLPSDAAAQLDTIVNGLKNSSSLRLQLMAYAGSDTMTPNNARRMSLRRALSVRSYLIDKGMRSTRIDVRALGNKTTEKPLNRVDVMVVER